MVLSKDRASHSSGEVFLNSMCYQQEIQLCLLFSTSLLTRWADNTTGNDTFITQVVSMH